MPLPAAHGIIGASIIAISRRSVIFSRDWVSLSLGALLAISPDLDFIFVWILCFGGAWHRSFTHSVLFALLVGAMTSGIAGPPRIREAIVYASAVISHSLLDLFTTKTMAGVELFWPFYAYRFKLGLFNHLDVDLNAHSFSNFAVGLLKTSFMELLVLAPVFMLIIFLKRPR